MHLVRYSFREFAIKGMFKPKIFTSETVIKVMKKILYATFLLIVVISAQAKKPNILFFYADDWGKMASCYTDDSVFGKINETFQTPAFDRLANEGARFRNAFYPVSQCTPCRASIATGSYFWRTGNTAFLNHKDGGPKKFVDSGLPGFGPALVNQGYFVASAGKTFKSNWSKAKVVTERNARFRYSLYIEEGTAPSKLEEEYRVLIKGILGQRKEGQPFYFVYGPINTHRPWIKGSGAKLWNLNPDDLTDRMPVFLPDVPEVREDMADYIGEVLALDLMLHCFMEELEKAGELDNTVVIATGDNGPPGFTRGKTNCYGFALRAPLLVRWPGVVKPGTVIDDFLNLMDLGPTFQEIAGAEAGKEMDGLSILPLLKAGKSGHIDPSRNHVIVGRERHVHSAREGSLSYPSRAMITKDFLYIDNPHEERWPQGEPKKSATVTTPKKLAELGEETYGAFEDIDGSPTKSFVMSLRDDVDQRKYWEYAFAKRPKEELYLLENDADSMVNLANHPKYQAVKEKLAQKLMAVRQATKDPRLTDAFDQMPWTNPGVKEKSNK